MDLELAPAPTRPAEPARLAALRGALPAVALALAFRAGCYAAMTGLAIWNELRPAPTVPDVLVSSIPYVPWVARLNYVAWLVLYAPVAALLLWTAPRRFVRYTVAGGLVSLARGITIVLTGLGAPDAAHAGPGLAGAEPWRAFVALASPWQVFAHDAMSVYLTKDLFFSGHTATTFLLVLYCWRFPRLRVAAVLGHVVVVATVFLSHLHYAIDVAGAYAFTFAIFALREGWPAPRGAADQAPPP